MDENGDIRAKLADALAKVEILQSANHIGLPFERQMEAKLYILRRQIAEYRSILEWLPLLLPFGYFLEEPKPCLLAPEILGLVSG
jgi:hypothetical protein